MLVTVLLLMLSAMLLPALLPEGLVPPCWQCCTVTNKGLHPANALSTAPAWLWGSTRCYLGDTKVCHCATGVPIAHTAPYAAENKLRERRTAYVCCMCLAAT